MKRYNWYNLPKIIKTNLKLDVEEFSCIDAEAFNKELATLNWGNMIPTLNRLRAILEINKTSWFNLPKMMQEIVDKIESIEC